MAKQSVSIEGIGDVAVHMLTRDEALSFGLLESDFLCEKILEIPEGTITSFQPVSKGYELARKIGFTPLSLEEFEKVVAYCRENQGNANCRALLRSMSQNSIGEILARDEEQRRSGYAHVRTAADLYQEISEVSCDHLVCGAGLRERR